MKFPRRTLPEPDINLTPLIDVVFLLLIFFMVSTTFTRETRLAVNLPEADAQLSDSVSDQIEVSVSQAGRYSVNGVVLRGSEAASIGEALLGAADGDRRRAILLVADADASHQSVVTAMDAIGQAGFSRLSIATRRPGSGEESASPSDQSPDP